MVDSKVRKCFPKCLLALVSVVKFSFTIRARPQTSEEKNPAHNVCMLEKLKICDGDFLDSNLHITRQYLP